MSEEVRVAASLDSERCAELCAEALAELDTVRGGPLLARREVGLVAKALLRPGGLDRLLADDRRRVIVGVIDDVVVGLAVGRLDQVGEAALGVVDGCFVEPSARGVGVGTAMLEWLVEWFGRSRCRGIDAVALPGDRRAKSFFEGAGFKARLITMHQVLE